MSENKIIMPESNFSVDKNLSIDEFIRAKETGNFVVTKVNSFSKQKNALIVSFENNQNGEIPLEEFSIYPTTKPNGNLTPTVYCKIGKLVCATVKEVISSHQIILSRKENMLKTFNLIKCNQKLHCTITGISSCGIFVDAGFGINGLIPMENVCATYIRNPSDIGFKVHSSIDAFVSSIDYEKHRLVLNHKDTVSNKAHTHHVGDVISVIVFEQVNEDGYSAYVDVSTSGIVNIPSDINVPYGSKIIARIRNFSDTYPDKLKLTFISFD